MKETVVELALPVSDMVVRLGVAAILGALVGLERERLERAAGLRTHALVALASALVMIVSAYGFEDVLNSDRSVVLDPSRVAAQVISGIGFLGAGVIIFRKNAVRGLTTAASVWTVAGIGLAAGGGLLVTAAVATVFVLFIQAGLRPLERHFFDHHSPQQVVLRVQRTESSLTAVEAAVSQSRLQLRGLRMRPARGATEDKIELDFVSASPKKASELLDALRQIDGLRIVNYTMGEIRTPDVQPDLLKRRGWAW